MPVIARSEKSSPWTCGLRGGLPGVGGAPLVRLRRLVPRSLFSASSRSLSSLFALRASLRARTSSSCSAFSRRLVSFVASQRSAFRFTSATVASFCASTHSHDSVYERDVKIFDFVKSSRGCGRLRCLAGIISRRAKKVLMSHGSHDSCRCS